MPHHDLTAVSGTVTHVFGHRFVVKTADGDILADITPKGLEQISLRAGDVVALDGEMKPSELKVTRFTCNGKSIDVEHKKKHPHDHGDANPSLAVQAARTAGFATLGTPRRKPKHFEVLGRRNGQLIELHIELDGRIRKSKPIELDDPKWREAALRT